ncbi:MAG: hypothetical protein Q9183_003348 [Haloplaca sp. 2 TL-2023]
MPLTLRELSKTGTKRALGGQKDITFDCAEGSVWENLESVVKPANVPMVISLSPPRTKTRKTDEQQFKEDRVGSTWGETIDGVCIATE